MNFFANLSTTQKGLLVAIMAVVIYVVSTSLTYSLVSKVSGKSASTGLTASTPGTSGAQDEPDEPRTEACPLDGEMHTKTAKQAWEKRRPLAVMIENHVDARPQSGLSAADVVYEAVAEGGITRFMAVFLCTYPDVQVGPVRSARTYFLDWVSEYDALYAHVGGANQPGPADALSQINLYDVKDLNQFSIGFPTFWRDYERLGRQVATEHTMYSTTQKLWAVGEKRTWGSADAKGVKWDKAFVAWKFKDPAPAGAGQATKITVPFWNNQTQYTVEWNYDSTCNCYKRKNGGEDHIDMNNKKQIQPKNVVVQFMAESHANDGYEGNVHLLYATNGKKGAPSGQALIFQDGKVIKGTWKKADRLARTKFYDASNQEISFNKGQVFIQTVPTGNTVTY